MKYISTTKLSEKLGVERNALFSQLLKLDLIFKKDGKWLLTNYGKKIDGRIIKSDKYGEFIAWPETFNPLKENPSSMDSKSSKMEILNATKIGEKFDISSQRINNILAEIGWIEKAIKGWQLTLAGSRVGGVQKEHQSGGTYVVWPTTILVNEIFYRSVNPHKGVSFDDLDANSDSSEQSDPGYQQEPPINTYPETRLKAKDGHMVTSRGELIIDNMLYDAGIVHAYERELPIKKLVKTDFYIPAKNGGKAVYIEFWGIKDNEEYLKRKKIKQEIYKNEGYNLINIEPEHYENLERYLIKELLNYDIKVE